VEKKMVTMEIELGAVFFFFYFLFSFFSFYSIFISMQWNPCSVARVLS